MKDSRLRSLCLTLILAFVANPESHAVLIGVDFDTGDLYSISEQDASMSLIGSTGIANLSSLRYRQSDGMLYSFTVNRRLYQIDPTTAATQLVGIMNTTETLFEGSLAIAPNGLAYGTNTGTDQQSSLFSVDLATANVTSIGIMGAHDINGLAWRSDGKLVALNRVQNSILEIDPLTAGTSLVTPLSPIVGALGGIAAENGSYYFSTGGPGSLAPGSNELYSFDPFTGAHTLIGSFSSTINGQGISGLAWVPEPSGMVVAILFSLGFVATRRRR